MEVWTGKHRYIWPGPASYSSRHGLWRRKLASTRYSMEQEVERLDELLSTNEQLLKRIRDS
ncbi:MAG: hypothetical protein Q9190_002692, partial [Brigantiaea leucoxantha]